MKAMGWVGMDERGGKEGGEEEWGSSRMLTLRRWSFFWSSAMCNRSE